MAGFCGCSGGSFGGRFSSGVALGASQLSMCRHGPALLHWHDQMIELGQNSPIDAALEVDNIVD